MRVFTVRIILFVLHGGKDWSGSSQTDRLLWNHKPTDLSRMKDQSRNEETKDQMGEEDDARSNFGGAPSRQRHRVAGDVGDGGFLLRFSGSSESCGPIQVVTWVDLEGMVTFKCFSTHATKRAGSSLSKCDFVYSVMTFREEALPHTTKHKYVW